MKILFMGTGEISVPTLRWLAASGHEVAGVFTQPDRPAGRGSKMTPPAIKLVAEELGFPVWQPEHLRRREVVESIGELTVDLIVVMAYGQILPRAVLDAPRLACLNLHASILPKYRGAAPIQAAILAGDDQSGVTVMHMAEGLDTGDVFLIESIDLAADETGGSLHDRLAEVAPTALGRALALIGVGVIRREPQVDALATHVGKLSREDGLVDWSKSAVEIERMVRAYHPWPGTMTRLRKDPSSKAKVLKLLPPTSVEMVASHDVESGGVLQADKHGILVATGDPRSALRLTRVQPESKKAMSADAYLAGRPFGDLSSFE